MPEKSRLEKNKELLKNPKVRAMLQTIRYAEGTSGELGYNTRVGGGVFHDLSKKPRGRFFVDSIGQESSAEGAYQFLDKTWDRVAKKLGLKDFSPEAQDLAAVELLRERGVIDQLEKGDIDGAIHKASGEWSSLPTTKGKSAHEGQNARELGELKHKYKVRENVERRINMKISDRIEIKRAFDKKIADIDAMKISTISKKKLKDDLVQQTFETGDLDIINAGIRYHQSRFDQFEKEYPADWKEAVKQGKNMGYDEESYRITRNAAQERNIVLDDGKVIHGYPKTRPDFYHMPGYTPPELTEEEIEAENPETGKGDGTGNGGDGGKKNILPEVQQTPWTDDALLASFNNDEMFADPQFKYAPGKQEFPMEMLLNIAGGVIGMKAADTPMPMRDEHVSEGLLNYAADWEKISQMGLDPAKEGQLKNDLASMYQTGLTNIVRASNGNRNLVLGNQGQLDSARMKGVVDIAMLDLDRRDKAMAQFGEVQKYISEFDANRSIANHGIKYREAEKKQMAGAALAEASFAGLMQNLQYARENGPGSANDMYKQYLMFNISGINPGVKDNGLGDTPGTASYAEKARKDNLARKSEVDKARDFILNMGKDDRKAFDDFRKENPKYDPTFNRSFSFDEMADAWRNASGTTNGKAAFHDIQNTPEGLLLLSPEQLADDTPITESPFPPKGGSVRAGATGIIPDAPSTRAGAYNPPPDAPSAGGPTAATAQKASGDGIPDILTIAPRSDVAMNSQLQKNNGGEGLPADILAVGERTKQAIAQSQAAQQQMATAQQNTSVYHQGDPLRAAAEQKFNAKQKQDEEKLSLLINP